VLLRCENGECRFTVSVPVTDLAGESFHIDLNATRRDDGRFSTPRILAAAIARPLTAGPELIELRNRCATAARSLGEFIC